MRQPQLEIDHVDRISILGFYKVEVCNASPPFKADLSEFTERFVTSNKTLYMCLSFATFIVHSYIRNGDEQA